MSQLSVSAASPALYRPESCRFRPDGSRVTAQMGSNRARYALVLALLLGLGSALVSTSSGSAQCSTRDGTCDSVSTALPSCASVVSGCLAAAACSLRWDARLTGRSGLL